IAVIFLRMFSETIQSMIDFHNRLVATHHVHFGNVLAAKITNEALRSETLSRMALALADIVMVPETGKASGKA
ncbi:MAG TPA: hypothetical protein VGR16_10990, partial [Thermomicrobiales bacterium]|nr:hypothetical protein [Thermomicrobiales bacterium]